MEQSENNEKARSREKWERRKETEKKRKSRAFKHPKCNIVSNMKAMQKSRNAIMELEEKINKSDLMHATLCAKEFIQFLSCLKLAQKDQEKQDLNIRT